MFIGLNLKWRDGLILIISVRALVNKLCSLMQTIEIRDIDLNHHIAMIE